MAGGTRVRPLPDSPSDPALFTPDADGNGQITERITVLLPAGAAYLLIDGEIPINLLHLLTKHINNSLKHLWLTSRLQLSR